MNRLKINLLLLAFSVILIMAGVLISFLSKIQIFLSDFYFQEEDLRTLNIFQCALVGPHEVRYIGNIFTLVLFCPWSDNILQHYYSVLFFSLFFILISIKCYAPKNPFIIFLKLLFILRSLMQYFILLYAMHEEIDVRLYNPAKIYFISQRYYKLSWYLIWLLSGFWVFISVEEIRESIKRKKDTNSQRNQASLKT